jgi:hypothetical protein
MASAPDLEAVRRAATQAGAGSPLIRQVDSHEATTAPPRERPDPVRMVAQRPAKPTAVSPHVRLRQPKKSPLGLILGGLFFVGACVFGWYMLAGPGRGGSVAVSITTDPTGAIVLDGERELGTTPLVIRVPRGTEPKQLAFKKDGFFGAQRMVTPKENQSLAVRLMAVPKQDEEAAAEPTGAAPTGAKPVPVAEKPAPPKPVVAEKPAPPPKPAPPVEKPKPAPVAEKPAPKPAPTVSKPQPAKPVVEPVAVDKPKPKKKPKKEDTLILTPSF